MKIKHWQGYGSVNATVKKKSMAMTGKGFEDRSIVIEVVGNHECGIELPFTDNYRLAQWLGKVGGFKEEEIKSYTQNGFSKPNEDLHTEEDHCIYTIQLKDKLF